MLYYMGWHEFCVVKYTYMCPAWGGLSWFYSVIIFVHVFCDVAKGDSAQLCHCLAFLLLL